MQQQVRTLVRMLVLAVFTAGLAGCGNDPVGTTPLTLRIVAAEYDQHEIKGVIGRCDFFIGSRMHACIAALSQGVPCVGVAYSMKFEGVFASVGMGEGVVDGRAMPNAAAIARTMDLYRIRNDVRDGLAQRADEARVTLRAVFKSMFTKPVAGVETPVPVATQHVQWQQP